MSDQSKGMDGIEIAERRGQRRGEGLRSLRRKASGVRSAAAVMGQPGEHVVHLAGDEIG